MRGTSRPSDYGEEPCPECGVWFCAGMSLAVHRSQAHKYCGRVDEKILRLTAAEHSVKNVVQAGAGRNGRAAR